MSNTTLRMLQADLDLYAAVGGFEPVKVDGKATFEKVVARNPMLGVTLFPPPDTKEEAAEYAAFIRDWLDKVASKNLVAEAGA